MNSDAYVENTTGFCKNLNIDLVKNVFIFNQISSTNIKAKDLAQHGEQEGTIVISRTQTKGRGRFDRKWESPRGGLYSSIILRPKIKPDKTTLLTMVGSLSVCKTINSLYGLSSTIKWPNDVMINRKKVAGILLEAELDNDKVDYVVLGIGLNLNTNLDLLPPELRYNSTSIFNELNQTVDHHSFLKHLFMTLNEHYSKFINQDINSILSEWKKQSDTIGRNVRILTSSEKIIGKAFDIDESGFLIITTNLGEQKKITSGDCFYIE